jgi:response regulator RpfG family c-di-GMP phosphodiesterase
MEYVIEVIKIIEKTKKLYNSNKDKKGEENLDSKLKNGILIIDDESDTSFLMKKMLNYLGYNNITIKQDGYYAFNYIKNEIKNNSYKPFDIIITDNDMPIMGGVEFLNKLYEMDILNQHRFLLISGSLGKMKTELNGLLNNTISNSIEKPFEMKSLGYHIKDLLRQPIKYQNIEYNK